MSEQTVSPKVKNPLQRQITVLLSLVIVGLVLLVELPVFFITIRLQQQQSLQQQQELTEEMAQTLSQIIRGLETNRLQVMANDLTRPDVSANTGQLATIINLTVSRISAQIHDAFSAGRPLESLLATNPQVRGLRQFDLAGNQLAQVWRDEGDSLQDSLTRPGQESLTMVRAGVNVQEAFFFDEAGQAVLVVTTPTFSQDQVAGLVMVWVELSGVWPYLVDYRVGRQGYLYLIDQDGHFVAGPDRFAAAVPPERPQTGQPSQPYRGLSQQQVIGRTAAIDGTPWQVVVELPLTEARAPLRSLSIILLAILSFGIGLALMVARLVGRQLLQPVHVLHQGVTRISAGDLAYRIDLEREDELGFLAGAFNRMVAQLEQTISELRRVNLNLLSAQETERQQIAQEIHDELGQTLTALKLNLWLLQQTDPENENLLAAQAQATHAQEKARTLSHELRPPMLDDLGLLPTLEWLIDRVEQRANLAISLDVQFDEARLSPIVKTTLYRLITEALTNVSRHAQASVVEISLCQQAAVLTLEISDDGVGFDPTSLDQSETLGLAGMRERVNLLQGDFLLESRVGAGTYLRMTLPLDDANPPATLPTPQEGLADSPLLDEKDDPVTIPERLPDQKTAQQELLGDEQYPHPLEEES